MKLYKVNEALLPALTAHHLILADCTREDAVAYGRRLRQSSVLTHTRTFVAWVLIGPEGQEEIARGEA